MEAMVDSCWIASRHSMLGMLDSTSTCWTFLQVSWRLHASLLCLIWPTITCSILICPSIWNPGVSLTFGSFGRRSTWGSVFFQLNNKLLQEQQRECGHDQFLWGQKQVWLYEYWQSSPDPKEVQKDCQLPIECQSFLWIEMACSL